METKEERLKRLGDTIGDLQQWQKEILEMSTEEYSLIIDEMGRENEIHLTQSQANMLEKVLGLYNG